ncbi:MAG: galactose-1-phosphate uridylyltransferase [Bacteriovoracaceae bacterium]
MFKKTLTKPDGRSLYLYSHRPISDNIVPTNPKNDGGKAAPHMRWHPLRREWVVYAGHRQNRTFLPPKDFSPLAVSKNPEFPTEMPQGDYDIAVFENLFPSLNETTTEKPDLYVKTAPAKGVCEVVVFTQDPDTALGHMPLERVELVLKVWADRTVELAKREDIHFVMPFENKGVEMGVTLHHPHGQIYAYSFIPPVQERVLESMKAHPKGKLLEEVIADELKDGRRIIVETDTVVAFLPAFARYTYETWIAPKKAYQHLHAMDPKTMKDMAFVLKTLLLKYDGLWQRPFPYLMTLFQAPVDGDDYPYAHLYLQLTPPYRTKDKLKFLAGTELGAGTFINDSFPEEKAKELKDVTVEKFV